MLIDIQSNGSLKFRSDPSVPAYDNVEDSLVGVVNHSGATVFGISLSGSDIFGFDGDGAGDPTGSFWASGSPYGAFPGGPFGPTTYEGPGTSFSVVDANTGTVNFTSGLDVGKSLWFRLEGAPSEIRLSRSVTIDPGHGTTRGAVKQAMGAIGQTDYLASSPPVGKHQEDILAVSIALALRTRLQDRPLWRPDGVRQPVTTVLGGLP